MKDLKQLIRESINEYINGIDEAGENAALEAKMNATTEAIELREKKMKMEGLDEAYHDMLDKGKMKELSSEIKALKKSLAKYEKTLAKLKSKGEKAEETPEEIIDEISLGENDDEGMRYEGMSESLTPEEEEELDMIKDEIRYAVNSDSTGTPKMMERYKILKAKQNQMPAPPEELNIDINESFLHMQKLAGLITEAQYQAKKK